MCWSFEVSIATGLWGWFVSAIAFYRNGSARERYSAIFLFAFSAIQLVEALLWWDINENGDVPCTGFNQLITSTLLLGVLIGQLLMNLFGALVTGHKINKAVIALVVIFSTVLLVRRLWVSAALPDWPCTTVSPSGHLLWFNIRYPWQVTVLFSVVHTLPIVYMRPIRAMLVTLACLWGAFLYAAVATDSNGSMWCFWGNVWSFIVLLDPWLFGRDAKKVKQAKGTPKQKKAKANKAN